MIVPPSVDGYRILAKRRLPAYLFEYIDGGSLGEQTLAANLDDLRRLRLRQTVLRDVSALSTSIDLLGREISLPLVLAPVGLAGMFARRGEVQAARAAAAAGIPFCLSSASICDLREVVRAVGHAPWFQLYVTRDRDYMRVLIRRAADLGCPVLVITVDLAVPSRRYRDFRTGLALPPSAGRFLKLTADSLAHPRWSWDVAIRGRPHSFGNFVEGIAEARSLRNFGGWSKRNYDNSVTWEDIARIRDDWPGLIILKGILDPEDAERAAAEGASAIIVSNHGGRQLDGAASTVASLPAIVDRLAGRIPVLVDGGIRSGLDMLKVMALGATACLVGRAWAYGLGARGGRGVSEVLEILADELRSSMALSGCANVQAANRSMII